MSEPAIQSDVAVLDSDDVAAENRTEASQHNQEEEFDYPVDDLGNEA